MAIRKDEIADASSTFRSTLRSLRARSVKRAALIGRGKRCVRERVDPRGRERERERERENRNAAESQRHRFPARLFANSPFNAAFIIHRVNRHLIKRTNLPSIMGGSRIPWRKQKLINPASGRSVPSAGSIAENYSSELPNAG